MLIDLSKPNLREVPVGTQVKTTKGFVWELVARYDMVTGIRESWKDHTTNFVWSDTRDKGINHHQAVEKYGDGLPTKEEFEEAESHGIREVMDLSDRWFWSSSVHRKYSDVAYGFSGYDGDIGNGSREYSNSYGAALCVGR